MIKVTKCSLGHSEIKLLGYGVNQTGIKIDTGKIKDIVRDPP